MKISSKDDTGAFKVFRAKSTTIHFLLLSERNQTELLIGSALFLKNLIHSSALNRSATISNRFSDDDPELKQLTEHIRQGTSGPTR